jgi:hypothetical protein
VCGRVVGAGAGGLLVVGEGTAGEEQICELAEILSLSVCIIMPLLLS